MLHLFFDQFMKTKIGLLLLLVFTGLHFFEAFPGYGLDIIAQDAGADHGGVLIQSS